MIQRLIRLRFALAHPLAGDIDAIGHCLALRADDRLAHAAVGGQGLNTSVQDAYNLGWKLAAVAASPLTRCSTAMRKSAAAVLGLATNLLDAMKRGNMRARP